MSKPDKPEWLVPISRVVHHAIQPGAIRVKAGSQAEAISLALSALDFGHTQSVEWDPVSEIQDASSPEIAGDRDVLHYPAPDFSPPSPDVMVMLPRAEAGALMLLVTQYLDLDTVTLTPNDADYALSLAAAQYCPGRSLQAHDAARARSEPVQEP
jgi:hypothetical protein